ncbi:unnamed protein product [Darwinula stevensoni]|uniref:Uncharacterized protein n=1 Tax=Darwinula stevensoni TaxID=69355 RepID=A0A7R9A153_9CRUS|nr:unnamed protein product [Darwinula stevensoni]CAG0885851.1 unnamed protein product [Darwinula stevensoni]
MARGDAFPQRRISRETDKKKKKGVLTEIFICCDRENERKQGDPVHYSTEGRKKKGDFYQRQTTVEHQGQAPAGIWAPWDFYRCEKRHEEKRKSSSSDDPEEETVNKRKKISDFFPPRNN